MGRSRGVVTAIGLVSCFVVACTAAPPAASPTTAATAQPAASVVTAGGPSSPSSAAPASPASSSPVSASPGPASPVPSVQTSPVAAANPYLAAPGEPLVPIKAAWCAVSGGFIHMFVARDDGIFKKYGLDVSTTLVRGSDSALAALQTGDIDFLYCAAEATIPGMAAGADAVLVGAPLVGLPYQLVAGPEIKSVQDLRGKTIAISRLGDLDDRLSHAMLAQEGVPADQVSFRPVGGQTERYQALQLKAVDAVTVTPPLDVQAEKDGYHVVYDLAKLNIPFIYSAVHVSSKTIRERPQIVQKFVAAMDESVYFVEHNKAAAEKSVANELKLDDQAALDSAYQAFAFTFVNRALTISIPAVQDSIDYARSQGTKIDRGRAEQLVDNQFADALKTSGFLQDIWGTSNP